MAKVFPAKLYPSPKVYRSGPWRGMHDAEEPLAGDPTRAVLLKNCYADSTGRRAVTGLPGFTQAGTQLGSAGSRVVQWIGDFTKTTGEPRNLLIANGEIYEYDFGGNTYTKVLNTATLTTATVTLSATATLYCLTFFDQLHVYDGTNTPFKWDGTTNGGVTELTNSPALLGQPVNYYSKLIGVKATEPDTIVWSEEGDSATGYEAGGYNNAWSLPGTKGEAIEALVAANDFLGVVRGRSTTAILGAVSTDFQTTGTRSAVSETIGTVSPGGVLVLDEGVVLIDSDGRPQFWGRGQGYLADPPLWDACAVTIRDLPRTALSKARVVLDDATGLIWVLVAGNGSTTINGGMLFERTGGVPVLVGATSGIPMSVVGTWTDADDTPRLVHAGLDDGYVYVHGTPRGDDWSWAYAAGTTAIPHEIRPGYLGEDIDEEKGWDEFSVEVMLPSTLSLDVYYETPGGESSTYQTITFSSSGARWDEGVWDTSVWPAGGTSTRERVGLEEHGRWLLPHIRHAQTGQQFQVIRCQAMAFAESRDPEID